MEQAPETTGEDVARRFVAGDDGALEALYRTHGSLVFTYCRRMLDPGRAADATQEVFVAAWRSRARYRPEAGTLAGWLLGIARFKVIDILRADGRQPVSVAEPERPGRQGSVDDRGPTEIAERMLVAEALSVLSERAQGMVRLAFFEDLTHAQIAEKCDVPLGTVKSDIRRGLERMRRHLEGFEDAPRS
jgi:RNA polymerase sigma-70 factor (ECF subfamily)